MEYIEKNPDAKSGEIIKYARKETQKRYQ